jgi:hypothetical protein
VTKIYFIILIILLSGLFVSIFGLIQKNNNKTITTNTANSEPAKPTPPPIVEITWPEAVDLIKNCKIKTVFQKRKLEVTLTDKNGLVFKTIEPKFNDIFNETNYLPSNCNDIIQTITE